MVPYEMDEIPYSTQSPVLPKQRFVYKLKVIPLGTDIRITLDTDNSPQP